MSMQEIKTNPVIISLLSILLTIGTIFIKDRVTQMVSSSDLTNKIELVQKQADETKIKLDDHLKVAVTRMEFDKLSEAQKSFITKEEANIQFKAIQDRLDLIQSDLRDVVRYVNKRQ